MENGLRRQPSNDICPICLEEAWLGSCGSEKFSAEAHIDETSRFPMVPRGSPCVCFNFNRCMFVEPLAGQQLGGWRCQLQHIKQLGHRAVPSLCPCDHMCSFTPSVYYCWLWINCCHLFCPCPSHCYLSTHCLFTPFQLSPFHQCPTIIGWLDNLLQNSHPTSQYLSISGVYSIFPSFSTHARRPASDIQYFFHSTRVAAL